MRPLFYTATAVFVVLAGVFAFYALQTPGQNGAAKIVLSIDTRTAPPGETASTADDARDTVAETAAPSTQQDSPATAAVEATDTPADRPDSLAGPQASESHQASRDDQVSLAPSSTESPDTRQAERVAAHEDAPRHQENIAAASDNSSAAVPGTMVIGLEDLDSDKPGSEAGSEAGSRSGYATEQPQVVIGTEEKPARIEPTETSEKPAPPEDLRLAALPQSEPVPASENNASPSDGQPSSNAAVEQAAPVQETITAAPADGPAPDAAAPAGPAASDNTVSPEERRHLRQEFDAFLAAMNQRPDAGANPAAALLPPPPVPPHRPENIPAPVRTAANGWAGTHFTTTEVAAPKTSKTSRIAILLRGVGHDERNSSDAVTKLPAAISLGFMPFSGGSQQWARKARELGHEVIVQLPLEPSDYPINNPGPDTLLTSAGGDENVSRMRTILGRFENYSGVTNYLGGKLLQSKDSLRPILENLKSQGLIYVGEGNNSHAVVRGLASEIGLRYGNADIILDAQPTPAAIAKALEQLTALARKRGSAIGMAYASRTTIAQLELWSKALATEGVTLVPVGVLAQTPGAS